MIDKPDRFTEDPGRLILHPGAWLSAELLVICLRASNEVANVIEEIGQVGFRSVHGWSANDTDQLVRA